MTPTPARTQTQAAVEKVMHRNAITQAYVESQRRKDLVLSVVILILALALAVSVWKNVNVEPRYFATTPNGEVIPMTPLDYPMHRSDQVVRWATDKAMRAFMYDFANYRVQLEGMRPNFTKAGWDAYTRELNDKGIVDAIVKRRLVVTSAVTQAAVVTQEGVGVPRQGVYGWKIELPMIISYGDSNNARNDQHVVIKLQVVRRSTLDAEEGIGIESLVAMPR